MRAYFVEDGYVNEPINDNIYNAINDFYNFVHLIKKSWSNKKYILRMSGAGYNVFDRDNTLQAWIGVKEKYKCLMFIIFSNGVLHSNAKQNFKGGMTILDYDEDLWIYSELNIVDILQAKTVNEQKEIIKAWLKENIEPIL